MSFLKNIVDPTKYFINQIQSLPAYQTFSKYAGRAAFAYSGLKAVGTLGQTVGGYLSDEMAIKHAIEVGAIHPDFWEVDQAKNSGYAALAITRSTVGFLGSAFGIPLAGTASQFICTHPLDVFKYGSCNDQERNKANIDKIKALAAAAENPYAQESPISYAVAKKRPNLVLGRTTIAKRPRIHY